MAEDENDRPVQETHEAILGAPGRADFEEEQYLPQDPYRTHRRILGLAASGFMVASVFFSRAVYGFEDGDHTTLFNTGYGMAEGLVAAIGLVAGWGVLNPMRPDPRVAQAIMLAAGLVSLVLGVTLFVGAVAALPSGSVQEVWPGPQAWLLIVAGILFVYLRWHRGLWPESPWEARILDAAARRRR